MATQSREPTAAEEQRARSARPDRGALDRLDPRYRTARQDLAADHAVVPGQLPVLHDPDRLRRPRPGPVPGLVDPGRRARHLVRHAVHGVPRHPGAGVRPASDDPDPGPARLPRRRGRAVRRAVHLHGLQRGRPGAAGQRAERGVRLEPDTGRHRDRDPGRGAGHLRLRLGAPGVPVPADYLVPVLRDHLGRDPGRPRRRRRPGAPRPLPVRRVHVPVLGGRRLQHHLRAVRLGLLPLHAARHPAAQHHRRGVLRRLQLGHLADRAGRLAGHPAEHQRRPGRPAEVRRQRGRPARLDHRVPVRGCPAGHDGHERVRRAC